MTGTLTELFVKGGWVMWPLLFFSIVTWAVVLERAYVFFTFRPRLMRLAESVFHALRSGDIASARQLCMSEKPYVSDVILGTLDTKRSKDLVERSTERSRARLMAYLKKNLWVLGTIGSASPFIGLLGTVLGIVRAFHDIQQSGAAGITVVGAGISEALVATAAGLVVAIIALLTYNIFVTAANQTLARLRITLEELVDATFEKEALRGANS